MVDQTGADALQRALKPHYAGNNAARLRLDIVPDPPHALRTPGDIACARALAGAWFLRFMGHEGS